MKVLSNIVFAIAVSAVSVSVYSQTAEDLNRRAADLAEKKKYDEALELFKKAAAAQDAQSGRVFHNRGWLMEMQGNISGALDNYREAVRRNPLLADSFERIGYWYYKAGKFADAVTMGEKVIKIDPANQDVKKWIPDAYRKKMERPGAGGETALTEEKPSPTVVEPEKKAEPKIAEKVKPDAPKEKEEVKKAKIQANFDITARTGYYYSDSKLKYVKSNGALFNLPYTVDFFFKPLPGSDTRFSFTAGNPYMGAAMPRVVNQFERTEAVFSFGPFGIGLGILTSHYHDDLNYGEDRFMTDLKVGAVFEFKSDESAVALRVYPRFVPLFYDNSHSTGKSFDACNFELRYKYILNESFSYFSRITSEDAFFFDHTAGYSNYWGYYDVALGLMLGNKAAILGKDVNISVEIGKRVYLEKLNADNPYTIANGSGFLGIDRKRTNKKIFSGYKSTSNIFIVTADQTITEYIFIYQKVHIEFVDRHNDHHEYSLTLGVGGRL